MPERSQAEVLVVEPDAASATAILNGLDRARYRVEWVDSPEKAFNCLESNPFDVLITELRDGRLDGIRLMNVAHNRNPDMCVIIIANDPDVGLATEAMRLGAADYQIKPLNLAKLEAVIQRGIDHQALVQEQFQLRRRLDERYGLGSLVGQSRAVAQAYNRVRDIAPSTLPVIAVGEPGTGKSLVAQIVHSLSPRSDGPLVAVSAGSGSEPLIRRELFGHSAGAFAGAREARPGRTELADGGTLFLDSAANLPGAIVDELLKALELGQSQRLGESRTIPTDFRLIVSVQPGLSENDATQRLLDELTKQFDAAVIELPPLRQRRMDIPRLVTHFLERHAREGESRARRLSQDAMEVLERYDWPGNIGELRNTIDAMVLKAPDREILERSQIPPTIRDAVRPGNESVTVPIGTAMKDVERVMIEETLKHCNYDKEETAKALGIGLRTLYRKLNLYKNQR